MHEPSSSRAHFYGGRSNAYAVWDIQNLFASVCKRLCLLVALVTLGSIGAHARGTQVCDDAARLAAKETGVPLSILRAITRTETGRRQNGAVSPWPWTVNMEGKGVWFDSEDEALSYVFQHFKRGARSFDVGCFQINYKWHGHAFNSIDEMFAPEMNAQYAARFLARLFQETGDWDAAAGAFHSRTPEYAQKYLARYNTIKSSLISTSDDADAPERGPTITTKHNGFPLLKRGTTSAALGSLVILPDTPNRTIFARINPEG
ncbi:transglycosylase SLT domain-containing protein [Thalassovita taeanensis]|uniref:Transglycosylase SLT domain-containing protein n=1 Tax=Thalassovita taeanensis TaxID=657014 RepID=A0A1H9CJ54_9RHOB|nr:transglycosylase SLT domain-containing protein [Thalassovita taeanensis]SEQ01225.1 Transglycosylase SLT domain-containing protein [Thalassovita taeanensis]